MNEKLIATLDVRAMLLTCEMILQSALYRKESRGAHYREDFPATKKAWKRNIICVPLKDGSVRLKTRAVAPIRNKKVKELLKLPKPEVHVLE